MSETHVSPLRPYSQTDIKPVEHRCELSEGMDGYREPICLVSSQRRDSIQSDIVCYVEPVRIPFALLSPRAVVVIVVVVQRTRDAGGKGLDHGITRRESR